jgi:hypothetical protein
MKKIALGLNDIAIPGAPYANRMGAGPDDMAISNRFYGKEYADDKNENTLPIVKKTKETPEDVAYEEDPVAVKYFEYLLKMRSEKKARSNRKNSQKV